MGYERMSPSSGKYYDKDGNVRYFEDGFKLSGSNVETLLRVVNFINIPSGLFYESPMLDLSKVNKYGGALTMGVSQLYSLSLYVYDDLSDVQIAYERIASLDTRGNYTISKRDSLGKRGKIRITNGDSVAQTYNYLLIWGYQH